jgi:hypothetical protein
LLKSSWRGKPTGASRAACRRAGCHFQKAGLGPRPSIISGTDMSDARLPSREDTVEAKLEAIAHSQPRRPRGRLPSRLLSTSSHEDRRRFIRLSPTATAFPRMLASSWSRVKSATWSTAYRSPDLRIWRADAIHHGGTRARRRRFGEEGEAPVEYLKANRR